VTDACTKVGNPCVIGRANTMAKYRAWIGTAAHLMDSLGELYRRDLGCWCAPFSRRADVLVEFANAE